MPFVDLAAFSKRQVGVVASCSSISMQLAVFVQNVHFVRESTRHDPIFGVMNIM
jgi:hypothetical protein